MSWNVNQAVKYLQFVTEEYAALEEQNAQLRQTNRILREVNRPTKHQLRDLKRNAREANDKLEELRSYVGAQDDAELGAWVRGAATAVTLLRRTLNLDDDSTFADLVKVADRATLPTRPVHVGARVEVVQGKEDLNEFVGQVGTVVSPQGAGIYDWQVRLDGRGSAALFHDDELKVLDA